MASILFSYDQLIQIKSAASNVPMRGLPGEQLRPPTNIQHSLSQYVSESPWKSIHQLQPSPQTSQASLCFHNRHLNFNLIRDPEPEPPSQVAPTFLIIGNGEITNVQQQHPRELFAMIKTVYVQCPKQQLLAIHDYCILESGQCD